MWLTNVLKHLVMIVQLSVVSTMVSQGDNVLGDNIGIIAIKVINHTPTLPSVASLKVILKVRGLVITMHPAWDINVQNYNNT